MPRKKSSPSPEAITETAEIVDAKAYIRAQEREIIRNLVEKAKAGSFQHAKFLFDYAGLLPGPGGEDDEKEASLARLLLEQFRDPSPDEQLNATAGGADESV